MQKEFYRQHLSGGRKPPETGPAQGAYAPRSAGMLLSILIVRY